MKVRELQRWFITHITDSGKPYSVDKNQAKIVLDSHKNTLVTARAGSGKTRTIVAKITYLLAHENIAPSSIIVFAFNRKACQEINERLTKICFDNKPLFDNPPSIATTFHSFAYQLMGGKSALENRLVTDESPSQFITRAEQKFFKDYNLLFQKISEIKDPKKHEILLTEFKNLQTYHQKLANENKLNFNQLVASAAQRLTEKIATENYQTPYRYIFVDEYQDFSLLFLEMIQALRKTCPAAHLLTVGDDWQAINRFAGSDVEYFNHFEKYFPEDSAKLFIPTNYRSGKLIVKNANFFMGKCIGDYRGCKAKNKTRANIFVKNIMFESYEKTVLDIIKNNPGKSIKILDRNNDLNFIRTSLTDFTTKIKQQIASKFPDFDVENLITESTIHRSKGLESDIVILLEIDANKFPGPDKTDGLYEIFGDTKENLFRDEARLFYVALTRPKEKLYILSKTTKIRKETKKYNFLSYLNQEWIEEL
ncbi:UvrD-helicase domain-containing protein [Candidatus Saccharibacteria bacterium]|nr:UvrD-helicase domain-containing protein [Candidatus Saccharibacteria bacterium]